MLVSEVINAAGRKLGLVVSGESFTAAELADGLLALQSMLRSWSAEKISVFASTRETHTLVPGTFVYTYGATGDINTARPNKILSAFITDSSDVTHHVEVTGSAKYNGITLKSVSDRPRFLYPQYTFPLINLYLYPVPSTAETLTIESLKPFTEASSFSATTDEIDFPSHYEEAIIYNLAIRLAPEFSKSIGNEVLAMAVSSYKRLRTLNTSNFVDSVQLDFPVRSGGRYSINSDSSGV